MACAELEALRLALMNITGTVDEGVKQHAEAELEGYLDEPGPIQALAEASTLDEAQRHLDAALVELEEEAMQADDDDPQSGYLRGRVVAVRDAQRTLSRLRGQTDSFLEDLGEAHHTLHETFPVEE
ncbi:DUF3209 family protein [Halogeometricum borinquense]|uniref:DUF3209 family protein n=2 Tax=Halogeometricum borinquense TaxID=60847 RepID=E4NKQ1_HALBP|nr:DUF3209 family protein [Halogeometricum borinquense]ADQ65947.1 Protein of unknown function (DUF3209) [Halogeometricum borinquense DSM 11551]ELY23103.1 hypothetical protein C499_19242 [Halogeometricum borinquense DSM 11551]QIB76194.1 DUF3209 family protein [Halogeometricum borinquense]QIQ75363.1 DUF3209 family protein [Halogeometricum borinquense]RYJ14159.1 DUF3209 family protein [Halogeometricum borinquense]